MIITKYRSRIHAALTPQTTRRTFDGLLEPQVQQKTFYVDLKENARGKYIKIAERGRYRPKSSIVLPVSGLAQFIVLLDYYMQEVSAGR